MTVKRYVKNILWSVVLLKNLDCIIFAKIIEKTRADSGNVQTKNETFAVVRVTRAFGYEK